MRLHILRTILVVMFASSVCADDSTSVQNAAAYLTPGKIYNYSVNIRVDGQIKTAASSEPQKLDANLELKVRHKIDKGALPGETQSILSVTSASVLAGDKKVPLAPSTFPQVTVLIDKDGKITHVFGGSDRGLPGANFSSLMLILLPRMPKMDLSQMKDGEQWINEVALPDTGRSVKVTSVFKGCQKLNEIDTVLLNQSFELTPPKDASAQKSHLKSMKGSATTNYSLSGSAPRKSHAEAEITGEPLQEAETIENTAPTQQEPGEFRAKLSLDLLLID